MSSDANARRSMGIPSLRGIDGCSSGDGRCSARLQMRLILVAQDYPPARGGIQTYCWELARRWAQRSEEFSVIAPRQPGARDFDGLHGIRVRRVAGGDDAFFASAAVCLAGESPSVTLHSQWPSALAAQWLRDRQRGGSVFVAAHGRELLLRPWDRVDAAQRMYDSVRRRALRRADGVFAVSEYTGGLVEQMGVARAKIVVQGNGTDPDLFSPGETGLRAQYGLEDDLLFLTVARLVPRKGVDLTLQAFATMQLDDSCARLVIVGEGPERARLTALARELGIAERVTFVGGVEHSRLIDWYRTADVFVLPARSEPPDVEGFGIVYLEAGACGLPVIGPNVGGPTSAIVDGVTGYCVSPDDSVALAAVMSRLAREPALRARLGDAGRKHVLNHANWDRVADRIWSEMEAIAGSR